MVFVHRVLLWMSFTHPTRCSHQNPEPYLLMCACAEVEGLWWEAELRVPFAQFPFTFKYAVRDTPPANSAGEVSLGVKVRCHGDSETQQQASIWGCQGARGVGVVGG
jgi:hypothetical protein